MSIIEARKALQPLLERYHQYKNDKTIIGNERQVGQSLIEPFISKVLHWETEKPSQFRVEYPQNGKRMDYLVRNEGISQFVIEAKKITRDIFGDEEAYKQAISYARGKEKDFAIVTNFKQVVVLRCDRDIHPLQTEIAKFELVGASDEDLQIILYFERGYWLSRGKNNELYSKLAHYKKRIPIDEELVENMSKWRSIISTNIRKNSKPNQFDFDDEQVKMDVEGEIQKLINRLVFVCYCEDKDFRDRELKSFLNEKKERSWDKKSFLLNKINILFANYNLDYNSDLFESSDCDKLLIDDDKLVVVLEDLRDPKGKLPPDFEAIEADILGKAYEQFIGHIQTGEKRVKEKEDIGKRKKEGIYYTPKYIVDYIVNNTVREYIKGMSFEQINKVKILDPACGSGSFLLRAFDVLVEEGEAKLKRRLNYEEKKNLMLNCIHGVDLDKRAVSIAKLNLSLKMVVRGEKLPMLNETIFQGNSLIDDEKVAGWDAFVWEEHFKDIMQKGGFDVVVGNPPYVNNRNLPEKDKLFFEKNYETAYQQYDIYVLFYEKGLKLLKEYGSLGFIAPNKFAITKYGAPLRKLFLKYKIIKVLDVSHLGVFADASTYPYVMVIQKSAQRNNTLLIERPDHSDFNKREKIEIGQNELKGDEPFLFNLNKKEQSILNKIIGDRVIDIYRAKPTSKEVGRGSGIAITNKEIERYGILKSIKKISNNKDWLIDIPAILMKKICFSPTAALTTNKDLIPINTVYVIHSTKGEVSLEYLLAIINSKLIAYYTRKKFGVTAMQGGFIELRTFEIESIPIKIDRKFGEIFKAKVNNLQSLKKSLNDHPNLKARIEPEIEKTDKEIDELVYQLYGITEPEQRVIEDSLK